MTSLADRPWARRLRRLVTGVPFLVYPVVPAGQARIHVQISEAHEPEHLERAVAAFVKIGRAHGILR